MIAAVLRAAAAEQTYRALHRLPDNQSGEGVPLRSRDPPGRIVGGVVLVDHVRSLPWIARNADIMGKAPPDMLEEVRAKLAAVTGIEA